MICTVRVSSYISFAPSTGRPILAKDTDGSGERGAMYLKDVDARKVLTSVADLADIESPEELRTAALHELLRLIPAEVAAYNVIQIHPLSYNLQVLPDTRAEDPAGAIRPHLREDPFAGAIRLGLPGGERDAMRLTDLTTLRSWKRTNLYNYAYRPVGLVQQMACGLEEHAGEPGNYTLDSYAVLRDARRFTDRERDLLTFMVHHLRRLHRRADERSRLAAVANALQEAFRDDSLGLATVDVGGAVTARDPRAAALLDLPAVRDSGELRRITSVRLRAPVDLLIPDSGATVRLRAVPTTQPSLNCVLLMDSAPGACASRLPRLTRRERDVLSLIAAGLTADAAGRQLRLSPRTVHKYLERAYAKLGVHDRVSAVLRARDLGVLGTDRAR
jgi:DNA-binding CsgD family transcriptional regulator